MKANGQIGTLRTSWRALALGALAVLWCQVGSASLEEDGENAIAEYESGNLIDGMAMLEEAAKAGYAPAQAKLGYVLDQAEENALALEWYRKAAAQNDPAGQFGVAKMYAAGDGVPRNDEIALEMIKAAAEQGYREAIRAYAAAYENGDLGLDIDWEEALRWYHRGFELGDPSSARRLVDAYEFGQLDVEPDPQEALRIRREAAAMRREELEGAGGQP